MKDVTWDKRVEHEGREGGKPPIFISWWKGEQLVGVYSRKSMDEEPITWGWLFE